MPPAAGSRGREGPLDVALERPRDDDDTMSPPEDGSVLILKGKQRIRSTSLSHPCRMTATGTSPSDRNHECFQASSVKRMIEFISLFLPVLTVRQRGLKQNAQAPIPPSSTQLPPSLSRKSGGSQTEMYASARRFLGHKMTTILER